MSASSFSSTTTVVDNGKLVTSTYTDANENITSSITIQSNKILLSGNEGDDANTFLQAVLNIKPKVISVTKQSDLVVVNSINIISGNLISTITLPSENIGIGDYITIVNNTTNSLQVIDGSTNIDGIGTSDCNTFKIIYSSNKKRWSLLM